MKQPELGRKISELRAARGLTQEELVDKCNVSVRTIQRIESGEVTPRSYTIRTIFAALDYDLRNISVSAEPISHQTLAYLNRAWIAGIVYVLLGIIEGAADYFRITEDSEFMYAPYYISLKLIVLITFIAFQLGVLQVGTIYKEYLVRVMAIFIIAVTAASIGLDIASVYWAALDSEWVIIATAIMYGGVSILYGYAIMKLQHRLGRIASLAGALYIISGICFVIVLLVPFGLVLLFAAELLVIVALYKVRQMLIDNDQNRDQVLGAF